MDGKLAVAPMVSTDSQDSIAISVAEVKKPPQQQKQRKQRCSIGFYYIGDTRWAIHGAKVGLALVLVSLLYMLEVVHDRLGDNAMWAVMTVVVVFEFTAGGTISKGVNRGIGTILGGGLGTLVALLAQEIGGVGKAVTVGTSVFIIGAAATYFRMAPRIKKKYDYGVTIFILTFSLVSISGVRIDEIIKIACDRLSSIFMGFAMCVFISVFVFPVWAGNELHGSLASKFDVLASSIEESFEDCMKPSNEKIGTQTIHTPCRCSSILSSKSADEALANFAKWEPWHGRFGFYYPWGKYLQISELLRDLTASILSLKGCLGCKQQSSSLCSMMDVKDRFEATCTFFGCTLRELGDNIYNMRQTQQHETILASFENIRIELCSTMLVSTPTTIMNQKGILSGASIAGILLLLMDILDKVEALVKEVEELGKVASFSHQ